MAWRLSIWMCMTYLICAVVLVVMIIGVTHLSEIAGFIQGFFDGMKSPRVR